MNFLKRLQLLRDRNVGKVVLVVTHGIFSKGLDEVFKWIDKVYTTNSVTDFNFLSTEKGFSSFFQYKVI